MGLAAWLVEKFREWSDCDGDIERRFDKDTLLDTITLYWLTGCINSSFGLYHSLRHGERQAVRATARRSTHRLHPLSRGRAASAPLAGRPRL